MIFDGFDNDEDLFKALPPKQAPAASGIDISLDDLILERNEREANRDFSHLYETLQLQVSRPPRQFRDEDKENFVMNNSQQRLPTSKHKAPQKGRKTSGCLDPPGVSRQDLLGSQLSFGQNMPPQPSLTFDVERIGVHAKPSLAILAVLESGESEDEDFPFETEGRNAANPKGTFASPIKKSKRAGLLGIRNSMQHDGDTPVFKKQDHKCRKRNQSSNSDHKRRRLPCRLLIRDPGLSMQEVSLFRQRKKEKQEPRRSFSVNSIAREIFKAAQMPENPSFHSIHSMEHIGMSNVDLDDGTSEVCRVCQKDFRVNDVVARTYACQHAFHKACLDSELYKGSVEGGEPKCPTCQRLI